MSTRHPWRVRSRRTVKVAALVVTVVCGGLFAGQTAGASDSATQSATTTAKVTPSSAFHETKTIYRTNLINGRNVVVDKRTVSLSVNITSNLIDRQVINVSWSGAHPTGGIQPDPTASTEALYQEYPMVLLECHGDTSPSAPAAKQIQPEDCWTATPTERYFSGTTPFPPWRLDRYATAVGQRNFQVNEPASPPKDCFLLNVAQYWLPYVSANGTNYPIGPGGCAGMPGEMDLTGGLGILPSNELFAPTQIDGKGSSEFDVWTTTLNPDLGCTYHVSCALVAVPIMGISCDPAAKSMPFIDRPTPGAEEQQAAAACEEQGYFKPGSIALAGESADGELPVEGALWWAASNWRNRFVVPLHFAPPTDICKIVNKGGLTIQMYGSELLDQAQLQWQPHFCLAPKKPFTVGYVAESEPEAAGGLEIGEIDAALVTNQPFAGLFPVPVVHAPVAETGFAISFVIDNAAGQPVTTLRLDPRLLAKLLTESYPSLIDIADHDPELLHRCYGSDPIPVAGTDKCANPINITDDPEFEALNPGVTAAGGDFAAASTLLALSSDSNVMWALTSYINDNPAARAWLNGKPDPWGMVVNSEYKGIALPVSSWPLESTYEPADWLKGGGPYCYAADPSPVLPLIAAPQPFLTYNAEDVQFYISESELACAGNPSDPQSEHLEPLGPQLVGQRFILGVTTLADARRYDLNTAALLTYTKPGTPAAFTSAKGMTFVEPTAASLRSAASLLTPDPTNYDWDFPYSLYQSDSIKAAQAYPGAMMVYADIPTKKLPKADAVDYAAFLRYVGTDGQVPGGGVGQLAAGYLPLTAANHLGAEQQYTLSAAAAIAAQRGAIPALIPKVNHASPSPSPSPSSSSSDSDTPSPGASPSGSSTPTPTASIVSDTPSPSSSSRIALTPSANFGVIGYLLPVLAGLALIAAAAAFLILWRPRLNRSRPGSWGKR